MDKEIALDNGALRCLWQQARAVLCDGSAEEIQHFFRQRAMIVYRNQNYTIPPASCSARFPIGFRGGASWNSGWL